MGVGGGGGGWKRMWSCGRGEEGMDDLNILEVSL